MASSPRGERMKRALAASRTRWTLRLIALVFAVSGMAWPLLQAAGRHLVPTSAQAAELKGGSDVHADVRGHASVIHPVPGRVFYAANQQVCLQPLGGHEYTALQCTGVAYVLLAPFVVLVPDVLIAMRRISRKTLRGSGPPSPSAEDRP